MREKLTMLGSCGVPLHTASNVITDLCWQLCLDPLPPPPSQMQGPQGGGKGCGGFKHSGSSQSPDACGMSARARRKETQVGLCEWLSLLHVGGHLL